MQKGKTGYHLHTYVLLLQHLGEGFLTLPNPFTPFNICQNAIPPTFQGDRPDGPNSITARSPTSKLLWLEFTPWG